jgi:SET domain-containing protein
MQDQLTYAVALAVIGIALGCMVLWTFEGVLFGGGSSKKTRQQRRPSTSSSSPALSSTQKVEDGTLEIRASKCGGPNGRGVFATRDIAKDQLIEECPLLLIEDIEYTSQNHPLSTYLFQVDDDTSALALGYGSLYNHAGKKANATYAIDEDDRLLRVYAARSIDADEEITVNYGTGYWSGDTDPVEC